MQRPAIPPQNIRVGDMWSREVVISFNGEVLADGRWIHVDAVAGLGTRVVRKTDGTLASVDGNLQTETVSGTFEVLWRQGCDA